MELIVHKGAGNTVPLYTGKNPKICPGEDRLSTRYLKELEKLPTLHSQGDGMRSFVGLLLNSFLSQYSIVLIDEPEAFLHPPQSRLVGKMFAKDLPSDRQIFIATHDEDFIKGLLDTESKNVKVIRITRKDNVNLISELNNSDIKEIWNDSLLRHSNILNGLFHSKVILCEADSDCKFYNAILDTIYENSNQVSPDILFTHCGGKSRLPVVIKALKKIDVPTVVITDFDVLRDKNEFKSIIEELGGTWDSFEQSWQRVSNSINQRKNQLEKDELKVKIDELFNSIKEKHINDDQIKQIKQLLKKASPWSLAKEIGKSFISKGDDTVVFEELNKMLIKLGLFIVEVGELESFDKSVGNHGPNWVNEVLKKDIKNDPTFNLCKDFIKKIISQ